MKCVRARPVRCDQCYVLVINGVVTHELGCPDSWKGKWAECKNCPQMFRLRRWDQKFCSWSCKRDYHG